MPLEPGERYTNIDVDIMHQLKETKNRLKLYELLRKTRTNPNILLAVGEVKMLQFNLRSQFNLLGSIKGFVRMTDLALLERALPQEADFVTTLSIGALRYGLAKYADDQDFRRKYESFIFDINPCEINRFDLDYVDGELLGPKFMELVRASDPVDPFERKYIILPVWWLADSFVLLIINPMGAIKKAREPRVGTCHIYLIGTTKLQFFRDKMMPRIMKVLRLFKDMFSGAKGYTRFVEESIEIEDIVLPKLDYYEKPIQMLWTIKQLMGDIQNHVELIGGIRSVGKVEMLEKLAKIRRQLAGDIFNDVVESSDKTANHLIRVRESIKTYIETHPEEPKEILTITLERYNELRIRHNNDMPEEFKVILAKIEKEEAEDSDEESDIKVEPESEEEEEDDDEEEETV